MTFNEWFDNEYPEDSFEKYHQPRQEIKNIMQEAWLAAQEQSCSNPRCSRAIYSRINELEQLIKDNNQ